MVARVPAASEPRELARRFARDATARVRTTFRERAPSLGRELTAWMRELAGARPAYRYFLTDAGYPILELPLTIAEAVTRARVAEFERDLTYSTVCGYYCLRLIDDALDGALVPGATHLLWQAVLASEFQVVYARHLADRPAFWKFFSSTWFECIESTQVDARLADIDLPTFQAICAKKTLAAKIPVRATLDYYGAPRAEAAWLELCDVLARFVQMADDLTDWPNDLGQAAPSYFLAEARRRRRRRETTAQWVAREGLEWAAASCREHLAELDARARSLHSHSLPLLLLRRRREFESRLTRQKAWLGEVTPLARHF
jgi:hypothetical protein